MKDIKWFTPESEDGERTLKQHAIIKATRRTPFTLTPYPGNKFLCNNGFISDDGEYALPFNEIEGEKPKPDRCQKCAKFAMRES